MVSIDTIKLGIDNCYLLRLDGRAVAIDAGIPGMGRRFERGLSRLGVEPGQIELLVITHGHWDHIGSARAIQAITGAKIAMHRTEHARLERPEKVMPAGVTAWGHLFGGVLRLALPFVSLRSARVDLLVGDEGLDLRGYGIPGRVIHTPGHSPGSLSVVLESGDAFVGDMAMDGAPLRLGPGLPIFAELSMDEIRATWRRIIEEHPITTVHPAHGRPFPVEVIRRAVS